MACNIKCTPGFVWSDGTEKICCWINVTYSNFICSWKLMLPSDNCCFRRDHNYACAPNFFPHPSSLVSILYFLLHCMVVSHVNIFTTFKAKQIIEKLLIMVILQAQCFYALYFAAKSCMYIMSYVIYIGKYNLYQLQQRNQDF